ncbi:hypothetical protein [Xenorhabdus sp. PB62.4]|uniref:hypothetical protein n=1 Tax=Xenorhabdus sp. PB62.4 TaxID=1851573 RepID=UPI001656B88D|nr:hypothetical protein [Xenorhabdus sp. PB62.4]MBC8953505.1 hypothetical protein [Xenorhabdus sp. PB62.4]
MEAAGKKFELEAFVSNYPVWVLGAPDCDDDDIAKRLTLQIAPHNYPKPEFSVEKPPTTKVGGYRSYPVTIPVLKLKTPL